MDVKRLSSGGRCAPGLLLILALLSVTTGCLTPPGQWLRQRFKVGSDYCRPSAMVAPDWIDAENPDLVTAPGDYSCWWRVFNDPILDELEAEAASENLQLRQAAMRVAEARALLNSARGTLGPQSQQATGGFARVQQSETTAVVFPVTGFDQWNVGFNASWELDVWGRYRRLVEAAEANHDSSIMSYDDMLVILQAEVARAYLQMRTLQERLAIVHRNVELQRQTLDLAEIRFKNGRVSELDVAQATTNLGATQAAIPPLEEALRKTQNALCVLVATPPVDLSGEMAVGRIPDPPEQVVVGIPADLLRRRPDVRNAERQVAIQSSLVGFTESNLYPHLALTGSIGVEAEHLSDLFKSESLVGTVGPGFSWDILNYGRLLNAYRGQKARFHQAILGYRQAVLEADRAVEDAIVAYLKEKERVEYLRTTVDSAERSVEIATLQYSEGKADFQRVLDTQRVLVLRQEALAGSRGQVNLNLVSLYKELGGGWHSRYKGMAPGAVMPVAPTLVPLPEIEEQPEPAPAPEPATDPVPQEASNAHEEGSNA